MVAAAGHRRGQLDIAVLEHGMGAGLAERHGPALAVGSHQRHGIGDAEAQRAPGRDLQREVMDDHADMVDSQTGRFMPSGRSGRAGDHRMPAGRMDMKAQESTHAPPCHPTSPPRFS